jgi:hypothetical protein
MSGSEYGKFATSCACLSVCARFVPRLQLAKKTYMKLRAWHGTLILHFPANMDAALSTRRTIPCRCKIGMCATLQYGLVIVSDWQTNQLDMYSLIDGTLVKQVGGKGRGRSEFHHGQGLCLGPCGDSVLVAEFYNSRVQEVRIADGSWVRFIGVGQLHKPQQVDCNADVIVVSETWDHISVLSWAGGRLLARIGNWGSGPSRLKCPLGVRLLATGNEVLIADCSNHRLCVFRLSGEFVAAVGCSSGGLRSPCAVVQCVADDGYLVANTYGDDVLIKLSTRGVTTNVYHTEEARNCDDNKYNGIKALVALPNNGYLVLDMCKDRVQQLMDCRARLAWMRACARRRRSCDMRPS